MTDEQIDRVARFRRGLDASLDDPLAVALAALIDALTAGQPPVTAMHAAVVEHDVARHRQRDSDRHRAAREAHRVQLDTAWRS